MNRDGATTTSEQQLLQFYAARMVSAVKVSANAPVAAPDANLPAGKIRKGTLMSAQLMRDTMLGINGKMGTLGCDKVGDVSPYVVTPFSGATGSRQWQEKWLVKGCGKQYAMDVDFKEDGERGAYWTIRN